MTRALVVVEPGLFATVQDLGRPGLGHLGVPVGGALDARSLRIGNRIAGNAEGAAAIEATLVGGAFRFEDEATFALTGAETPATLGADGRPVARCAPVLARAGEVLRLGRATKGARVYLCVAGGIDVPLVLGSRSTHVAAGFGGHEGRVLRAGDVLPVGAPRGAPRDAAADERGEVSSEEPIAATAGPHAELFDDAARRAFEEGRFVVTDRSDRVGLRLAGPTVRAPGSGSMTSEGMPRGAVQVTPSGEAIVLLADGPTTGGYPVIACAASRELSRLGQLRPRDAVRFRLEVRPPC